MPNPKINVTPLIDVLLVLLIIFMVISPLKPTRFEAKIPAESKDKAIVNDNPHSLVVSLRPDLSLKLNNQNNLGTVSSPEKLITKLVETFDKRKENRVYNENLLSNNNLTEEEKIQKTVFIKAPRKIEFGLVAKLIDAVKTAGADPISLQIDYLD